MRILVCGSRHMTDVNLMRKIILQHFNPGDTLIHGNAKGADILSEYCVKKLLGNEVSIERYPADWNTHGRKAGPIRNQRMLKEGKPELVIAFLAPDSRGTKHMIEIAEKAGITVKIVHFVTETDHCS